MIQDSSHPRAAAAGVPSPLRMLCLVLGLVSSIFLGASGTAQAGCGYLHPSEQLFAGGEEGRVAEIYHWTKGPMIRVYIDGRIKYYQAATGAVPQGPCRGPGCRGRAPTEPTLQPVMLLDSSRLPVAVCCLTDELPPPRLWSGQSPASTLEWPSPLVAGLLRPPCPLF